MATYFHELGHYKCNTYQCEHCEKNDISNGGELHAIISELETAMEHNCTEVMKASFMKYKDWLCDWKGYQNCQIYADAVLTIQSSKL